MTNLTVTTISPEGQLVIPQDICRQMGLKSGSQYLVMGQKDVIILKAVMPPSMEEFDDLIAEARKQAKRAGLKRSDIAAAIEKVRSRK